jgi:hypothetical protein
MAALPLLLRRSVLLPAGWSQPAFSSPLLSRLPAALLSGFQFILQIVSEGGAERRILCREK